MMDNIKLAIYEAEMINEITEHEKEVLLEMVNIMESDDSYFTEGVGVSAMLTVASYVGAGLTAAALFSVLVCKLIGRMKLNDKIKASTELTEINNSIKETSKKLSAAKIELNKIISEYKSEIGDAMDRSDFYGSKSIRSKELVNVKYNDTTHSYDPVYMPVYKQNYQYDRQKSADEARKAAEMRQTLHKYMKVKDSINKEVKNLKQLKKRFYSVVRNNTSDTEAVSIMTELDKITRSLETF